MAFLGSQSTFAKSLLVASTADLKNWRANAWTTQCLALGHNKARMNEVRVSLIDYELEERGERCHAFVDGEYNGPGST